jgi:hypothetical protein
MLFGWAWLAAVAALAVHVLDEASHDFLSWYNPNALRIRRALGNVVPFPPTFTFVSWLSTLALVVVGLGTLTPSAFAGHAWMKPLAFVLAAEHLLNGVVHLGGGVVLRRAVPGILSAPFLLVTGAWLAWAAAALG